MPASGELERERNKIQTRTVYRAQEGGAHNWDGCGKRK